MTLFFPKITPFLLLGEHYHFPAMAITSRYLAIHHATLSADKKTIQVVSKILNYAKAQSREDLVSVLNRCNAPISRFLPALIDSAKSPLFTYQPHRVDRDVLRSLGWKM